MKRIYNIVFLIALLFSITANAQPSSAQLTVDLPDLSTTLSYQQPVRLSQLLSDVQGLIHKKNGVSTFWLAAQLLQEDKSVQIEHLKNKVLKDLQALSRSESELLESLELLANFIESHDFNYRHFISLDNDLVRLDSDKNPLLKGNFKLLLPSRINKIRMVGVLDPQQTADLRAHARVNDYLKTVSLPASSDSSFVYIIQPDGTVSRVDNSYWSHQPTFFAPGAILFIGVNSLPDEYVLLNKQIAELFRYITPLTERRKG